ncbi:LruC domain-containing protein [Pedobacter sp. SYSU D00535]|uniref:LruC domain-containing protein n=1 Tax=Pedobacter sp. SYSU D00535 TaxID=2810308 RepID=UPI001A96CA69|nr:LruC domain-containing protein [Pedobacter sp. SYSU D00535]
MKHFSPIVILLAALSLVACRKTPGDGTDPNIHKVAPDGFDYATSKKIDVNVRLLSSKNEPLKGVVLSITSPKSGETLVSGASDAQGYVKTSVNIPSYLDTVLIEPNYVGLISKVQALIKNGSVECVIGGSEGLSGNVVMGAVASSGEYRGKNLITTLATSYSYMGTHDNNGRPNYLSTPGEVSSAFLSYLNASLPERKDVRNHHPEYIDQDAAQHLNIVANSDVYITFVSEGADYQNAIGYYTYTTGNPPRNKNDVGNIKYIFPNSSALGSGGGLRSGDRVKIGTFPAGTSVGFVLLSDAWQSSSRTVDNDALKFYSHKSLNPEPGGNLEVHTVLLNYKPENLFIIGFEDIRRDQSSCDHDFNDVVLYASSTPVNGISADKVIELDIPNDRDNDGVNDTFDQFPTDASKAYINYFPSKDKWGTFAFEDNWPTKGDYDVNDLVVNYRYTMISNANNLVVEMNADFAPVAAGASYMNGFGVQFPFAASDVTSVTGHKFINNYISLNSNGTEAGQSKAVIIPFDNHEALIKNFAGAYFINTKESMPKVTGDTAKMVIKLKSPMTTAKLGNAPFNPFLISNMRRGYEIHLPGYAPTDKATASLFGTMDDSSKPATGRYYLSKENGPWALSFTETFKYPSELNAIGDAYFHFAEWASSGGTLFSNWYTNSDTGYRDQSKIYSK